MGGSSSIENDAIVQEQQKQATDAQKKENERKARLKLGLQNIGKAFNGTAVTAPTTHAFSWKGFDDKTVLPKGYTRVQVDAKGKVVDPTKVAKAGKPYVDPNLNVPGTAGYNPNITATLPSAAANAAPATPATTTMIMGPDGKLHKIGEKFNYTTDDATGEVTGGFDQAFYDTYRNAHDDYYKADIQKQYGASTSEAAYRLARAGLGVSTAANTLNADLSGQKTANDLGVENQGIALTAALKDKVEAEKKAAIDQLYQTEDPTLAANTALASVRNLSLEKPAQSPLAQVFNVAAVGGANLLKNYNNQKAYNQFDSSLPNGAGSGRVV